MIFLLVFATTLLLSCPETAADNGQCLLCHQQKTPGIYAQWQKSAHEKSNVSCSDCHGRNHVLMENGKATVDAEICGLCHQKALNDHKASKHGTALHAAWSCTRNRADVNPQDCRFCHEENTATPKIKTQCAQFMMQSNEMGEIGCNRCHIVENSCGACHSNHNTDLAIVNDPSICAKCHMGPDHPQWEMWQTSIHGSLFYSQGDDVGPSCQTCHMRKGTHNVSHGITASPGNKIVPPAAFIEKRKHMLQICKQCHSERLALEELKKGDAIRIQSLALVDEARAIINDLADYNLLEPMPQERPPHPQKGHQLELGAQMLYEDISHIERLYFKMMKFDLAKTIKGSYHQNPAYSHWYGNAELKMDLVDIKAEVSRLKKQAIKNSPKDIQQRENDKEIKDISDKLKILKNKFERGNIDALVYQNEKNKILDELLKIDKQMKD